ncbi:unnamed protein product, partial [marine sediment metagenome]
CTALLKNNSENRHFFWEDIEFYRLTPKNFIKKVYSLTRIEKFDLLFIRDDFFLIFIGLLLKKRYKIPVLVHYTIPIKFITDFEYKWYHPKNLGGTIKHLLTIALMRKVDLVLPTSEWMGKYLASNGVKQERIHNYPNGANLSLFKVTKYPSNEANPTYIYIGAISKIRKLDILVKAMKIVCERYKNAQLYMLGYGDDVDDLQKLTKNHGLVENIIFTGMVPYEEVPIYIEKSHICLCSIAPLYHYKLASPLKLFEYMSCSRPVIANKEIPAHIAPITESKCGLLV